VPVHIRKQQVQLNMPRLHIKKMFHIVVSYCIGVKTTNDINFPKI